MGEEGVEGGGEEVRQGQLHMLSGWCRTKRHVRWAEIC